MSDSQAPKTDDKLQEALLLSLFCREARGHIRNYSHSEVLNTVTAPQVPSDQFSLQGDGKKIDNPYWHRSGPPIANSEERRQKAYKALLALVESGDITAHRGFRSTGVGINISQRGIDRVVNEGAIDADQLSQEMLAAMKEHAREGQKNFPASVHILREKALGNPWPHKQGRNARMANRRNPQKDESQPPCSEEIVRDGILVFLNLSRSFEKSAQPTKNRIIHFLTSPTCVVSTILPVCSDKRIANPFRCSEQTAKHAISWLEKEGMIECADTHLATKHYAITEKGTDAVKQKHSGQEWPRHIGNYEAAPDEVERWYLLMQRFGNLNAHSTGMGV